MYTKNRQKPNQRAIVSTINIFCSLTLIFFVYARLDHLTDVWLGILQEDECAEIEAI